MPSALWRLEQLDASLVIVVAFFVVCAAYGAMFDEQPLRTLRWCDTEREVQYCEIPPISKDEEWHVFLSA